MNLPQAVASRLLVPLLIGAAAATPVPLAAQRAPNVDVWFEQGNEFDRGQPGRVMYSGDAGSYVTVLRVDTDGRLTVLSPRQPNERSRFGASRSGIALPFQADPTQGVGYVFAVASRTPFDFRDYRGRGNSWNVGTLGARPGIDPFEIVDRFARASVGRRGAYSIAYAPYEIGRDGGGRASYQHGVRYDDNYGYYGGYEDPWGASPYRRGYDDFRYQGGYGYNGSGYNRGYDNRYGYGYGADSRYSRDPRTHSLRHCPDGTLAPYTTPCAAFARPGLQQRLDQQPIHAPLLPRPHSSPRPPMQRQERP
ncbi:MAG: hypothetical protein V4529_00590 [Gemmatimonadota bacterium]